MADFFLFKTLSEFRTHDYLLTNQESNFCLFLPLFFLFIYLQVFYFTSTFYFRNNYVCHMFFPRPNSYPSLITTPRQFVRIN